LPGMRPSRAAVASRDATAPASRNYGARIPILRRQR
jgi:hypothetical protein